MSEYYIVVVISRKFYAVSVFSVHTRQFLQPVPCPWLVRMVNWCRLRCMAATCLQLRCSLPGGPWTIGCWYVRSLWGGSAAWPSAPLCTQVCVCVCVSVCVCACVCVCVCVCVELISHVAVPYRNGILFRCAFRLRHGIQSAVSLNFH